MQFNSINRSLAKLDHISQMNWSKRDFNQDKISTNPQVFKRFLSTMDPKLFNSQPDLNGTTGH